MGIHNRESSLREVFKNLKQKRGNGNYVVNRSLAKYLVMNERNIGHEKERFYLRDESEIYCYGIRSFRKDEGLDRQDQVLE